MLLARNTALSITLILLILASCASPSSTASGDGAVSSVTSSLNIEVSGTSAPAGLLSYSPASASFKVLGNSYCLNGLSDLLAGTTTSATTGTATVIDGSAALAPASVVFSVNAAAAGTYRLRFVYAFGGTETNLRDAWVVVNGSKVLVDGDQVLEFAYTGVTDGKWTTYAYSSWVSVALVAGDNEIRLGAVGSPGYSRTITFARTGSGGTAGTPGTGYGAGLPNLSALEVTGPSVLAAGTGSTALYTVSASVKAGTGTLSVSPQQDYYLPGTSVTLTAVAGAGYVFDSWEGNLSSRAESATVAVSANLAVTARFIPSGLVSPTGLVGYGAVQDDEATAYTLTGGAGGTTVTVTTLAELRTELTSSSPVTVVVDGEITSGSDTVSASITVASNKTIYGSLTNQGRLKNIELKLNGENIIVRNLVSHEVVAYDGYDGSGNDNITINGGRHIWIDHCEFYSQLTPADCPDFSNASESGADGVIDQYDYKDYYDGQIDVSDEARWITISYSSFHDHWKSLLWGDSDTDTGDSALRITLHHNVFKNILSRLPMLRYGRAHVYNNYYDGPTSLEVNGTEFGSTGAGVDARCGAVLLVEGNVFANLKKPIFSSDGTGAVNATDNLYQGCRASNLVSKTSAWKPVYAWTPDAASVLDLAPPAAGVGLLTSLP